MQDGMKGDSDEQAVANNKERARRVVGRVFEVAILAIAFAAIWGLFSLPTVFFFMNREVTQESSSFSCIPKKFTGQLCRDALLRRQQCIPGRENTTEVYIQSELFGGLSQTEIEGIFENYQSIIDFQPSPECIEILIPFMCSYIFAPCSDTGQLHLPLQQECVSLRDGVCMQEWQEIVQQGLTFLPDCEALPQTSTSPLCQSMLNTDVPGMTENISNQSNKTVSSSQFPFEAIASNITCSKDFYLDTEAGFCKPECGQWKPFPDGVVVANTVIVIVSSVVGIAGGILIVTISILKYRHMTKFPSILILYQSSTIVLYLVVVLIGYMDTQAFLCPSQDGAESLLGTTTYCTLNGISDFYLLKLILIFWITHIATILWLVTYPLKAKQLESTKHFKVIHLLIVVVALVIPIGFVAAPLATGGFQPFYYPITCLAKNNDVSYYAFVLPDSILSAIGTSLLTLLFWVLIRRKWKKMFAVLLEVCSKKKPTSKCTDSAISVIPTTVLAKVLFSFLCYALVTILGYAAVAQQFQVQSQFVKELTEYFICESSGVSTGKVCDKTYEVLINPLLLSSAAFFLGILYPCVNILYVINMKEVFLCVRNKTRSAVITTSTAYNTDKTNVA